MNFSLLFLNNSKILLPELFLTTCILILLTYGVIYSTSYYYNYPIISQPTSGLSILTLLLTALLLNNNPIPFSIILNNTFIHDTLTTNSKIIVLVFAALCLLTASNYIKTQKINSFEYYILTLFSMLGVILLIGSYDLISAYLAIELQSLALYVMASFKKDSAFSTEAGLKYFILGAFSSGLLLFGSSLIYGFTGTTNFEDLARLLSNLNYLNESMLSVNSILVGITFISAGMLFKLAAAPFHMWSPDVYEGAPTTVSTFFAVVPKLGIFTIFLRLYHYAFYDLVLYWQHTIIWCALASVIVGSFVAIRQKKIKRLLAYSAISHVGYLLIAFSTGTIEGSQALLFYLVVYMVTSINIWNVVVSTETVGESRPRYNTDFASMVVTNPILAITTALILFSMAGVPPLAGFCAKLFVFFSAIESSLYFIAIIAILTSVISAFYYIRIIKIMFFEKNKKWFFYKSISRETSLVLGFTLFFTIFFFANPTLLFLLTHKMALSLYI
jgi:proton-translocating NADH-quinone oxidoreductase chain N